MDFERAERYWAEKAEEGTKMPPAELMAAIEDFLSSRNTCAFATGDLGGRLRCTPLEYTYKDGCFWFLSEGGLKFRGLRENKRAAVAVFDRYEGFGKLNGLEAEGTVEIIEPWSVEYVAFLEGKGYQAEKLRMLPATLYLIKFKPESYDFLSSSLKEKGRGIMQHLDMA